VVSDEELLQGDLVDGVVISTPNHLHEDQALAALKAGKHVLVERPLAFTAKGVDRLLTAARKAGRVLMAGMSHRYRPDAAALSSVVAGGELGRVYQVRGSWLNRKLHLNRPTWRQNAKLSGGGALMDLGIPALDLCLFMPETFGEVLELFWRLLRRDFRPHPRMQFVRGKRFQVRSDPPVFVQADGDIVGRTPLEIRVAPMAAEFLVPRRSISTNTEGAASSK
jgi:predicted dehydrogenase